MRAERKKKIEEKITKTKIMLIRDKQKNQENEEISTFRTSSAVEGYKFS